MCCAFTTLVLLGPRVAGIIWWIARPLYWQTYFSSAIWPILGLIFLPWTTLMYLLVAPHGIFGWDLAWLSLALVADLASYGGGAYGNRRRIPGYRTA